MTSLLGIPLVAAEPAGWRKRGLDGRLIALSGGIASRIETCCATLTFERSNVCLLTGNRNSSKTFAKFGEIGEIFKQNLGDSGAKLWSGAIYRNSAHVGGLRAPGRIRPVGIRYITNSCLFLVGILRIIPFHILQIHIQNSNNGP